MILRAMTKSNLIYLGVAAILLILPFFVTGRSVQFMITQIFIFAIFAMSYDLLLGYTGIISFGHAMFFGIGAYSTAIFMDRFDASFGGLILAVLVSVLFAAIVSFIVGMLTLRLKTHFYAMLTLAFAGLFLVAAEKMRWLTGGNDGFTFKVPEFLRDSTTLYIVSLVCLALIFFGLRRLTQSPFGRVLVAIRENEERTVSLGFKVLNYKVLVTVVAGIVASFAGVLYMLSLRFVNTSVFATDMTIDVLLMTIIGGVGTLVGPILGAALIELAHHWISGLANVHWIFERWIILYGTVYILVVIFFPLGIVGTIRSKLQGRSNRQLASKKKAG